MAIPLGLFVGGGTSPPHLVDLEVIGLVCLLGLLSVSFCLVLFLADVLFKAPSLGI